MEMKREMPECEMPRKGMGNERRRVRKESTGNDPAHSASHPTDQPLPRGHSTHRSPTSKL